MKSLIQFQIIVPLLSVLTFVCVGPLPVAQALVPPPDGDYAGANTAEGSRALNSLTPNAHGPAVENTALGFHTLYSDTRGSDNTATGANALLHNNGSFNTATGAGALYNNTTNGNTADGYQALFSNTTGSGNVAMGYQALYYNSDGGGNTAVGFQASQSLAGSANTAVGWSSLSGATGYNNTATGYIAGFALSGNENTAIGEEALFDWIGDDNTAVGRGAMNNLFVGDGSNNTAIGAAALTAHPPDRTSGNDNTAIGVDTLSSNHGNSNTAVGANAGANITTASYVICVGADLPAADVSNSCYIGNIWNQSGGSQAVYVNSQGKLGFQTSSRRFKDEIKPMDKASEVIYGLKPVSFRYKKEIEPTEPLGFGLIAEEVEKASPDLVGRGGDGKANTVRYEAVNAMLLNEFLKEHRKNEEQEATIARLIATDTRQQKQIEALTAALQKVSAQVELSKSAPQRVANDQ
jgi:hypothetical protein